MPLTTKPRPANVRSSQWLVPAAVRDVTQLTSLSEEEIIALGGLAHAYYRGPNDTGFQTISMNAATTLAATHLRHLEPEQLAYLTSSTGLSDEDLYVFSKWAHSMGGVHLNRMGCPSWTESKGAFINTFGTPDSTCMPEDLLSADLILLWGVDLDTWPPQLTEYLVGARARGASVLLIHPAQPERSVRPLSLKRVFHHPKTSTLYDRHIAIRPDGHLALVDALTQQWVQHGRVAEHFVHRHVNGWDAFKASLDTFHPRRAADAAGVSSQILPSLFRDLKHSDRWISILGEQFCAPPHGQDAAQAVLNLHLAAGMLGRRGTGVLNMTGSPTCAPAQRFGIDSDFGLDYLPKCNTSATEWSERWGLPVTMTRPLSAHDCIRQIQKGDIEGSIFLGPTSPPTGANGTGPLCRVHLSTHLDSAMLAPAQHTLLLPMGIGAEPSMYSTPFRIIHFHKPTAPYGGELRPAWRTLGDLAAKMRPHLSGHLKFQDVHAIRSEMQASFDAYTGVRGDRQHDWLQWSPPFEHGGFQRMPDQKAVFAVCANPVTRIPHQAYAVFDLGASKNQTPTIYISEADVHKLGCRPAQMAILKTPHGTIRGTIATRTHRSGCIWTHNATRLDTPDASHTPGWRAATLMLETTP